MDQEKNTEQTLIEAFTRQQTAFANAIMSETRKARRNANFRTIGFILVIVTIFTINILYSRGILGGITIPKGESYVSLVRINGPIEAGKPTALSELENNLYQAFHDEDSKGVLLVINSPGGTPVQSHKLHQYLMQLKEETGKRLVVLGDDMLTSGAYMVAVAADKILVNPATLTGSIGVFQQSFGLKNLAEKAGVTARTIVAGDNKRRLDPFTDAKPEDLLKVKSVLDEIHQQFIAVVRSSRKDKLSEADDLFSGDYWTGTEALSLGLVDGISTYHRVLKEEFGSEHALDYSLKPGLFGRLPSVSESIADSIVSRISSELSNINGPRL